MSVEAVEMPEKPNKIIPLHGTGLAHAATAVELLFKRHFWVIHLLFIFAASFFVTKTANAFIESRIMPLPTGAVRATTKVAVAEPVPQLITDRLAKLTGLPVPMPEVLVAEPATVTIDMNAAPVKSGLRVKLLGTMVDEDRPEWSMASIQDVTSLKSTTYMIDDVVLGAKVIEIERSRVIVLNNNRREYIDDKPGDGAAPAPVATTVAISAPIHNDAPPSQVLGAGVKQLSENDYEIPREEITKTLSNLNDVAMQARIVPAFKDGAAQGFKLFSIRPDSIYTKIGIQNGDVIKRINGLDMNSPEKALEIYSKLKDSARIDIEVERNGAAIRKTYNVR